MLRPAIATSVFTNSSQGYNIPPPQVMRNLHGPGPAVALTVSSVDAPPSIFLGSFGVMWLDVCQPVGVLTSMVRSLTKMECAATFASPV
jgi:hypothetical protein